jgi:hypothetical protein
VSQSSRRGLVGTLTEGRDPVAFQEAAVNLLVDEAHAHSSHYCLFTKGGGEVLPFLFRPKPRPSYKIYPQAFDWPIGQSNTRGTWPSDKQERSLSETARSAFIAEGWS